MARKNHGEENCGDSSASPRADVPGNSWVHFWATESTKGVVKCEHAERRTMFCCLTQTGLHAGERQQGRRWPDSCKFFW